MNANQETEKTLAHQASEWVTTLRGNASHQQLAAFAEWIRTSPRHVREFLTMMAIERELHGVDAEQQFGLRELDASRRSMTNVFELPGSAAKVTQGRPRAWLAAIAAAVLIAVTFIFSPLGPLDGNSYTTRTGEQRALELEDGSIVHLNTHSRVKVMISSEMRDIELVSGEALFKVRRDPSRPFRVHVAGTVIEALGTEFNVYRKSQDTVVSVLEGAVRVGSTRLSAGEQARFASADVVKKAVDRDPVKAVAWRQRRLVFDNDQLSDIVTEFNRYNTNLRFRLEGVDVTKYHFTGVFDADDPESLVQLLAAEPGLVVEKRDGGIEVRELRK